MKTFSEYLTEATQTINISSARKMFEKMLLPFVEKDIRLSDIVKAVQRGGQRYLYNVSIRKSPELESGDVSVFGFFDAEAAKEYYEEDGVDMPIELLLIFSSKDKTILMGREGVQSLANGLAETLAHEWIHLKQAQSRNWVGIKPKQKYLHKVENIDLAHYLGNDDEIEAHAMNIAGSALSKFGNKKQAIEFFKRPKMGVLDEHHFDLYLKLYGTSHAVTKRLFKKIVYYINNRK